MHGIIFLSLIACACIALVINSYIDINAFNRTGSKKFNFLTYFPFELTQSKKTIANKLPYIFFESLGLILLSSARLIFSLATKEANGAFVTSIFFFAFNLLFCLTFIALKFIKLSNFKLHCAFATAEVCFALLINFLYAFYFSSQSFAFINKMPSDAIRYSCFAVSFLLIIAEFALILNPSAKGWLRMVKIDAETFNRPKHCYLAIVEWGTLLVYFLSFIPLIIVFFF